MPRIVLAFCLIWLCSAADSIAAQPAISILYTANTFGNFHPCPT